VVRGDVEPRLRGCAGTLEAAGEWVGLPQLAVDNWVYEDTNATFIQDEAMRQRLMNLNPHSFRKVVATLLEVNGRGYWETSENHKCCANCIRRLKTGLKE